MNPAAHREAPIEREAGTKKRGEVHLRHSSVDGQRVFVSAIDRELRFDGEKGNTRRQRERPMAADTAIRLG